MVFSRDSHRVRSVLVDALALVLDYEDVVGVYISPFPDCWIVTKAFHSPVIYPRTTALLLIILYRT